MCAIRAFEQFTLCCVVIVIVSLSCILVASVQLLHGVEDGVNHDNSVLLQKLAKLRVGPPLIQVNESNRDPLLAVIIGSSKRNYALRRTIRRTWGQQGCGVVSRFMLQSSQRGTRSELNDRLQHLKRRDIGKSNARYFLFVNDHVFVNTRFLLEAIDRVLPTEGFMLCSSTIVGGMTGDNVTCDYSKPILLTADVAKGIETRNTMHDGKRLYLNRRETEALLSDQIDDVPRLAYFFTASLDQLLSREPLTQLIERLWLTAIGNYTSVEC